MLQLRALVLEAALGAVGSDSDGLRALELGCMFDGAHAMLVAGSAERVELFSGRCRELFQQDIDAEYRGLGIGRRIRAAVSGFRHPRSRQLRII